MEEKLIWKKKVKESRNLEMVTRIVCNDNKINNKLCF